MSVATCGSRKDGLVWPTMAEAISILIPIAWWDMVSCRALRGEISSYPKPMQQSHNSSVCCHSEAWWCGQYVCGHPHTSGSICMRTPPHNQDFQTPLPLIERK